MDSNNITTTDIFYGCTITGRFGLTVKIFIDHDGVVSLERPEGPDISTGWSNVCEVRELPCGCEWKVLGYSTGLTA